MVTWRLVCINMLVFKAVFATGFTAHTGSPSTDALCYLGFGCVAELKGPPLGDKRISTWLLDTGRPLRDLYQQHWPAERFVMQPQKKKKEIQKRKMKGRPERSVWRCYLGIRDSIWAADRFALWTPGGLTWNDFSASPAAEKTSRRR